MRASKGKGKSLSSSILIPGVVAYWQSLHRLPTDRLRTSLRQTLSEGNGNPDWRRCAQLWARTGAVTTRYLSRVRAKKPRPVVVLWDVSGSMADYIPLYLPWLWRLAHISSDVHVFPFGTSIVDITEHLRQPLPVAERELRKLDELWMGGTKIGAVLQEFLEKYASQGLASQTTVLVISDGWDVGDPNELSHAFARFRQDEAHIYWMNPLMATPGFQPRTRALLAAKPYLARMVSGHNKRALRELNLS